MKLSLDTLRLRAEAVASNDLLATISGGTNNDCHDTPTATTPPTTTTPASAPTPTKVSYEIKTNSSTINTTIRTGLTF